MAFLVNKIDVPQARDNAAIQHSQAADCFADIRVHSCRLAAMSHTADAARLAPLIEAGAWTDVALALIAIEIPNWQLRRLIYDEGEWHCALSNQREMPEWLDTAIETHDPEMAVAILNAIREALRSSAPVHLVIVPSSLAHSENFEAVLCENYT